MDENKPSTIVSNDGITTLLRDDAVKTKIMKYILRLNISDLKTLM